MKKTNLIASVLVVSLTLSGCGIYTSTPKSGVSKEPAVSRANVAGETTPDPSAPVSVELEPVKSTPVKPADPPASVRLTKAEAEAIALKHAAFSAGQVNGLRSKYDFDDAVAHYDVEFRVGQWEYEYEIHAETGAVLSFEKDD